MPVALTLCYCVALEEAVLLSLVFFFNDTATTEIYTLSLHDALPIWPRTWPFGPNTGAVQRHCARPDRKSTRLNSSHQIISYAVFCLKKKNIVEQDYAVSRNKNDAGS